MSAAIDIVNRIGVRLALRGRAIPSKRVAAMIDRAYWRARQLGG